MSYKQKLLEFNAGPKYRDEMLFMSKLIGADNTDKILDYGCGTGTMMEHLRSHSDAAIYGYDVENYLDEPVDFWWRQDFYFKFKKAYFMHSIAHIEDVRLQLIKLKDEFLLPDSTIYVLTPNASWISLQKNREYLADKTVVQHFTAKSLGELFVQCGFKVESQGQYGAELNGNHERLFLTARL